MSALVAACDVSVDKVINTGIENDCSLGLAAGIIMGPQSYTWNVSDMADPIAWLTTMFHADPTVRFLPVLQGKFDFGFSRESSTTETNPLTNIARVIVVGGFTFTYTWEKGGICLAGRLQGIQGRNYGYMPVDQDGRFMYKENADGTCSFLPSNDITSDYAPKTPTTSTKNILVVATPYKDYVNAKIVKSDTALDGLNGLLDVDIKQGGAPSISAAGTAAAGSFTITALGSDGDTINIKVNSVTISGVVTKTSAETTTTLLAAKVSAAINALTSTNGGYTAAPAGASGNLTAPIGLGSTLNGTPATATVTGGVTATFTNFIGGVTAVGKLKLKFVTHCGGTDLIASKGSVMADPDLIIIKDHATGAVITPSSTGIVAGLDEVNGPFLTGHTYDVTGSAASVWKANLVVGLDAVSSSLTQTF